MNLQKAAANSISLKIDEYIDSLRKDWNCNIILKDGSENKTKMQSTCAEYDKIIQHIRESVSEKEKMLSDYRKYSPEYYIALLNLDRIRIRLDDIITKREGIIMKINAIDENCALAETALNFKLTKIPEQISAQIYDLYSKNYSSLQEAKQFVPTENWVVLDKIIAAHNPPAENETAHGLKISIEEKPIRQAKPISLEEKVYQTPTNNYSNINESHPAQINSGINYYCSGLCKNFTKENLTEMTKFVQYRNENRHKGLKRIVDGYNSERIKSVDNAVDLLRLAAKQGFYLNRYDSKIASEGMKEEMAKEYCLNSGESLNKIAKRLSDKYCINVSASTIRNHARKSLGDYNITRRDSSAKKLYLTKIQI